MSASRIALRPFENASGDASQDILASGLGLDLATELARFATLEVIPPTFVADLRAKTNRPDDGTPTFVLAGSVRRLDQRIRISVQLTDTATGRQVWAERYDAEASEIFAVQDDVVARVAASLALKSDEARLAVARRKPLASLEAYECWLRGRSALQMGTLEGDREARALFERALELDPHFARAYAGLSLSHFNEWSCQAWIQWDDTERLAYTFARRAADLDTSDAMVEIVLGRITLYRGQVLEATRHIDRAIALNPHEPDVLAHAAACRALLGEGASGLELATTAARLNPSADWYVAPTALSLFVLGRYDESIAFGLRVPHATLDCPALLSAAFALAGDRARATTYLERFLADFEERVSFGRPPEVGEPLRWLLHVDPFQRPADVERVTEGLRLAGLPMDPDSQRAATVVVPTPGEPAASAQFRLRDDHWHLVFDGAAVELTDAKGLRDLASLLATPGDERHCLELAGRPAELGGDTAILDDRARREYRARLAELQRELDDAERDGDRARTGRAREEMEALVEALSDALGLGGRSRALGSGAERARSAITWRIRSAIKKIKTAHPSLGRHLENSVRTGTYCSYQPERPVAWQL